MLADHPEAVSTIGRWHWDEWGHADPSGSLETWNEALRGRAQRGHGIASALVRRSLREAARLGVERLYLYTQPTRASR